MRQTMGFCEGSSSGAHTRAGLLHFIGELNLLADSLGLSRRVKRRAASICADAEAMRFCRAMSRSVLAAAALYVACREYREPITLRELAEATGTDCRDVGKSYTTMLVRMHITRPSLNGGTYVRHLALGRPLSRETYELSQEIIRKATGAGLGGRNPMTLAAASLYLACCRMGEKVTQSEVAVSAGVGEESVRKCCRDLRSIAKP